jgi:guanine deaminase
VIQGGRLTGIDEAAVLAEIEAEYRGLAARYDAAEASVGPVLQAARRIVARSNATPVAPDTFEARLPSGASGARP